jgi:hypothetical protein
MGKGLVRIRDVDSWKFGYKVCDLWSEAGGSARPELARADSGNWRSSAGAFRQPELVKMQSCR